jgi:hypothetical protein
MWKLYGSKEDEWNAGDDVDEMNIGVPVTNFRIYGMADCDIDDDSSLPVFSNLIIE